MSGFCSVHKHFQEGCLQCESSPKSWREMNFSVRRISWGLYAVIDKSGKVVSEHFQTREDAHMALGKMLAEAAV